MNKPTLSLSEITYRILRERKFNKMIAEITAAMKSSSKMLKEAGIPSGIDQGILKVSKEVEEDGEDMDDEEVQAAMMMAAIEKGGDISKVNADDVEKELPTVKERRLVNESGGGVVDSVLTVASLVLGNMAFIEAVCTAIEKVTGKKISPDKAKKAAETVVGGFKKASGWVMKKIGQAIEWIIGKMGGGPNAQKIGAYGVKFIGVVAMFILGISHFPLAGASIIGIIISITSMIGKGFELIVLGKELIKYIKKAIKDNKELKAKMQAGGDTPAPAMA